MVTEAKRFAFADYAVVPNPSLREYLERYEAVLQLQPDTVGITQYRFEQVKDVKLPFVFHATRIANTLLKGGVILPVEVQSQDGRFIRNSRVFGLMERRALAAFYWTYLELPFQQGTFLKDFPERVALAKGALGKHPLASLIHDNMLPGTAVSSPTRLTSTSSPRQRVNPPEHNTDAVTLKDGRVVSLAYLHAQLERLPSNTMVDSIGLGVTKDEAWEIVGQVVKLRPGEDLGDLPVSRMRAAVKSLQVAMLQRDHRRRG